MPLYSFQELSLIYYHLMIVSRGPGHKVTFTFLGGSFIVTIPIFCIIIAFKIWSP